MDKSVEGSRRKGREKSSLYQPIPAYSSPFLVIIVFSCLVQAILAYSRLFK